MSLTATLSTEPECAGRAAPGFDPSPTQNLPPAGPERSPFIIFNHEAEPDDPVGGKASPLVRLQAGPGAIPAWFAVVPAAFEASLSPLRRSRWKNLRNSADAAEFAAGLHLDAGVRSAIEMAVAASGARWYAVRSSALDEDGGEQSFAGQLESFLYVEPTAVPEKVLDVWRSGFTARLLAYRLEHGLATPPTAPAVLVQKMIEAESAGVAFAADPVSGERGVAVVAATWGIGTSLVGGECDADTFRVDRDGRLVGQQVVAKQRRQVRRPQSAMGVGWEDVPACAINRPALDDGQVAAVAALVRTCSRRLGRPQDIEWAWAAGRLYLLQSRPITSLRSLADPAGELRIWDNSNIAESYSGVTSPLTFSFARTIYENVYRQFCRLMGVPRRRVEANRELFAQMLGLIEGRIYYNLLSWYRILALLPGFALNRRFMEQMMGVKEALPPTVVVAPAGGRVADAVHVALTLVGLVVNHALLPRKIRRFRRRLDCALAPAGPALEEMRPDELVAHYHDLERQLLTRWDAPLVNDFFAMIFHGLFRRLTVSWGGDQATRLQNDLIGGAGGMISTEPAQRLRQLAQLAAAEPGLVDLLCTGGRTEIETRLPAWPGFAAAYRDYLHKFGERCLEELKLESTTLHDDPLPLLRAIGQFARRAGSAPGNPEPRPDPDRRRHAEVALDGCLRGHPLRQLVFGWILRQARARVRDRENLRFERTRLFGRVRRIFMELGRRFSAEGALADPRDVFFLTVDEVTGFVEGRTVTTDLAALADLRRREFARHRAAPPPADRFETRGMVCTGNSFRVPTRETSPTGATLTGTGCCPGVVRGRARVVLDPRSAVVESGEILVAVRTDPGWILLFPAAAGLLVEHGSLLSHSAIVARELGLPAIVAIAGLTAWVRTGDWLELNGSTGVVCKLPASP